MAFFIALSLKWRAGIARPKDARPLLTPFCQHEWHPDTLPDMIPAGRVLTNP